MLQKWLWVTTDKEFDELWVKIRSSNPDIVPHSFVEYIEAEWLPGNII
jgi:hypothetical protein